MENIYVILISILVFILLIVIIHNIYYSINIKYIIKQLEEIKDVADTNKLLTVTAKQKDIINLVNIINDLIKDSRIFEIQIKKINDNLRKSIINISHDLRTPLTTSGGYLQMLQKSITDVEHLEYLSIILERHDMVNKLLNQLFEYVRIEAGEITYEHKVIDAKKIFTETIAIFYDDFYKKRQEPTIKLINDNCVIMGDEQGLKRIFSNIIFNSLIHGQGEYYFEISKTESIKFTFSNKCEFMSSDDLSLIFDRFYTKDQARKTTGLGLTIAKEITKSLNGKIDASYNNGIFSISISFPKI